MNIFLSDWALKQPTAQAGVAHGGVASRAVDGNKLRDWGSNTCILTGFVDDAWWRVDLGESLPVATVVIVNRDCPPEHGCADFMKTFEIRIGKAILVLLDCYFDQWQKKE